jgi:pyruvate dehydrogenase E2 component (dihydrolipoamide acetyltransferase)
MFAVEHFIAIINPPEAGILAVGSAMEVPVGENIERKPGWPLCVKAAISVDHRVSDWAEGARFMQALPKKHRDDVAGFLENPVRVQVKRANFRSHIASEVFIFVDAANSIHCTHKSSI